MKNRLLKSITYISAAVWIISGCMLDSDTCIPFIALMTSTAWIAAFLYANGFMEEKDED